MEKPESQFLITTGRAQNKAEFYPTWQSTNTELGKILVGFDCYLPSHTFEKILALIQDTVDGYFLRQDLADPAGSFQSVLDKFNSEFSSIVKEQISWTRKINITLALLLEDEIHFVNYGHNHLLLVRHKFYIDAIRHLSAHLQVPSNKIFDQLYSGSIKKFQRVVLCNQATLDYIEKDKLKDILSLLPLQNINSQIEQIVKEAPRNQTIGGVVIQHQPISSQTQLNQAAQAISTAGLDPLSDLENTSQKTAKLLRPKILPDWSGWIKKIKLIPSFILNYFKNTKSTESEQINLPVKIKKSKEKFKNISLKPATWYRKIKHRQTSLAQSLKNLPSNLVFNYKNYKSKILALPISSRILLFSILLVLVIVSINIGTLSFRKRTEIKSEYYQTLLQEINSYHDEAESAIIYGDLAKAREFLKNSQNLIFQLPTNNQEREENQISLNQKNQELFAQANKLDTISSPFVFLPLEQINQPGQIKKIILAGNNIVLLAPNSLINISQNTREITETSLPFSSTEEDILIIGNGDNPIIYQPSKGQIYQFDSEENSLQELSTINALAEKNIIAGFVYNQNLYLLDKSDSQIWRLNRQGNSFSSPQAWLKESADLQKAVDIAIDGTIYILYSDGQVTQYIRGNRQDWQLNHPEPGFSQTSSLYSTPDTPYIYFIDQTGKKIAIYDKQGILIKQYYSENFSHLQDLIIGYKQDGDRSFAYLLDESNLYQISIAE